MKRAFTLTELIAVIIILGVIASIAFPVITNLLIKSKEELYNSQVQMIKESAFKWGIENINELSETEKVYLSVEQLIQAGLIKQKSLKDPRNEEKEMNGCIIIEYNDSYSTYEYDYKELTCTELAP